MKIRVRDLDVDYEEVGAGRPLLLLHGGGPKASARWAMGLFEEMFGHRDRWRRIYVSQMGHGETPAPPWLTGMDDAVDVTLEFLQALAPGERFSVGGVSWGGYMARGVLHHAAPNIDGAFIWEPDNRFLVDERVPPQRIFRREPGFSLPADDGLAHLMIDETAAAWAEARRTVLRGDASNPDTPQFHRGRPFSFDPNELAEPFPGPALVLTGRQDNAVGYRYAFESLDLFPRGTHVVLDRCGHLTQVDQPAILKLLANEWLDRVEEYVGMN